jgi:serine/threonine protein kinase
LEEVSFVNFFPNCQLQLKNFLLGTFSEIYLAENIHHPEKDPAAIKVQTSNVESSVLKWEIHVLKSLQDEVTVPRFISSGIFEEKDYLIMELLRGEVMSNLRNRIRNLCSGIVPIPIAAYLARQMLTSIQNLHQHGYVHRDIKPSNFVRKNPESTQFVMIDFGLAKQVFFSISSFEFRFYQINLLFFSRSFVTKMAPSVFGKRKPNSEGPPSMLPRSFMTEKIKDRATTSVRSFMSSLTCFVGNYPGVMQRN